MFPPFSLIGRILQKLEDDKVRKAIIIIPMWVTQAWFPNLLQMLIQNPFRLPVTQKLLRLPHTNQYPASPAYGVYISQLIRYARACSNYSDFLKRHLHLRNRLLDQGYKKIRLIRSLKILSKYIPSLQKRL